MYFEWYVDARGEYRWTLVAANHKKIADSAEGYTTSAAMLHGLSLVKGDAHVVVRKRGAATLLSEALTRR